MLPVDVIEAAREGNLETVRNWLDDDSDGARDVNDIDDDPDDPDADGWTLLQNTSAGNDATITSEHVELARYLLSRGASVDAGAANRVTALLTACYISYGEARQELISLLLSAGASPNVRNEFGRTPLGAHVRFACPPHVEVVQSLLRAGASLDRCLDHNPIEAVLEDRETNLPESCNGEEWIAVKALIAGVRRAGSFKRYLHEPHREVLMLRGLAMRGHLAPKGTRRTRGAQKWKAAAAFLARLGDNGVVWNVLSFWRDTGARRTKTV